MTQRETNGARRVLTSYPARLLLAVVLIVGGALIAFQLGLVGERTPETPARAEAPAAQPAGRIGDGVWLVGADVQPGTYRSTGPSGDGYCMWSRHDSAAGGPMDGIIASDGDFDSRQMIVTIESSDVLFRTSGCAPFEKVS